MCKLLLYFLGCSSYIWEFYTVHKLSKLLTFMYAKIIYEITESYTLILTAIKIHNIFASFLNSNT